MRHLLASRGTAAAIVGMLALLGAGGYALASSGGKKITACVHRHGGGLYVAKHCAKRDKKISWNKVGRQGPQGARGQTGLTGPQGPGATSINFTTSGGTSTNPVTIGQAGPLTAMGTCTTTGSGPSATTQFVVSYAGPALHVDGSIILPNGSAQAYSASTPASATQHLGTVGPTSGQAAESAQLFVVPSSGTPVELMVTAVADGGSPNTGASPDTCHLSAVITPVAAPNG